MKNLLIIIFSIFAFGCSNDDAPAPVPVEYFYSVTIKNSCPDSNAELSRYCVTEEVYEAVKEYVRNYRETFPNQECVPAHFIDIDGIERQDFYDQSNRHNTNPCAED